MTRPVAVTSNRWPAIGAAVLLAVAALVAYWPALHGGFLLDDDALLTNSELVKASDGLFRMWFTTEPLDYWPLTNSSFWIEWRLWGFHTAGYHATNLLLHIGSAWLVWRILRRLSIPGSLLAAFLFAVHPVNVESVAWIAQRKNTLSMLFFLASIWCYLRFDLRPPPVERAKPPAATSKGKARAAQTPVPGPAPRYWYWLSLLAFVLAMLSKGSVAMLPFLLVVLIWWVRDAVTRDDILRILPFLVVAVVLTLVNIWFQNHTEAPLVRHATLLQRLLGAAAVVWFYLYKAVWPVTLIFVYPLWDVRADDVRWWIPLAAALATTAVLVMRRDRPVMRALLCAWLFFCLALVPVMGFTDVYFMKYSLVADHYQYIAMLAVVTIGAAAFSKLAARLPARSGPVAAGALVLLFGTATWRQSGQYADAQTIYRRTLDRNPSAWMAHNNLGLSLLKGSPADFQEGFGHLQTAVALQPGEATLQNNLGIALFQMGRFAEAADHHRESVRLSPTYADAFSNLAADDLKLGRFQEAVDAYQRALALKPLLPIRSSLANALQALGRTDEAKAQFDQALQSGAETVEGHGGRGDALLKLGRTDEAIVQYQEALRLEPGSPQTLNNLGYALMLVGRLDEAERALRQSLQLRPDDSDVHDNLGNVLQRMQRLDEAVSEFKIAIRNGSGVELANVHNDMGVALAMQGHRDEAVAQFREALRLRPDLATAQANLAKALGSRTP